MTRFDDCLTLLHYLETSGQSSLRKMQEDTGIPFSTIREYINPTVLCRKSWDELERMKKNNPFVYSYYITTIENPDKDGCQINLSKFTYLQKYGLLHGYHVDYNHSQKKVIVNKMNEDDFWDFV